MKTSLQSLIFFCPDLKTGAQSERKIMISDMKKIIVFNTGFRIMFMLAGVYAVIGMFLWLLVYTFGFEFGLPHELNMTWHAHEMIYGYTFAVIAGFLLTAVQNWTGLKTVNGFSLAVICCLWLGARLFYHLPGPGFLTVSVLLDTAFAVSLIYSVAVPVIKAKNYRQTVIMVILIFITLTNLVYYTGAINNERSLVEAGLYGAIYLIIILILVIGRRVIPFFTERGVGYEVSLKNYWFIDKINIPLLVVFGILQVFTGYTGVAAITALILFLINALRLYGWYTPGIWYKPLLWVLHVSYFMIVMGFGLIFISHFYSLNVYSYIHAFTLGGIGLMTLGMMARVSLGHTGRSVHESSSLLKLMFLLLIVSSAVRIFLPMILPLDYKLWIGISQILWIASFLVFLYRYIPILSYPRADGKPG